MSLSIFVVWQAASNSNTTADMPRGFRLNIQCRLWKMIGDKIASCTAWCHVAVGQHAGTGDGSLIALLRVHGEQVSARFLPNLSANELPPPLGAARS